MTPSAGPMEKLRYSDLLGVAASGLCAVHCALTPLFFATRPILENIIGKHHHASGYWALLDYLFLILGLIAVWYSARHTVHKGIKSILWAAWGVFALGLLSETFHFIYGMWFMYLGSIALVVAHIYNHRYCKKSKRDFTTENKNR
ncbi:MerC domain-containing protein [Spongiimicrobium salis]|uniref:MerC domain-containing protein n=1 Tax=Spongiimicrobium salis TaxID=1667022 RepID=UPI00374D2319